MRPNIYLFCFLLICGCSSPSKLLERTEPEALNRIPAADRTIIAETTPFFELAKLDPSEITFTLKSADLIKRALATFKVVLQAKSRGDRIDANFKLKMREAGMNLVIVDGKLYSTKNPLIHDKPHYLLLTLNSSIENLQILPAVTAGEVLQVKQISFRDPRDRSSLWIEFEDKEYSLQLYGWTNATLGDVRNHLKNVFDIDIDIDK